MNKTKTKEFKETEIGKIPADWEIKPFVDCVENNVGESKKSELKRFYKAQGKYPIIDQGKK